MILACNNISKAFGTDEVLSGVSFHINEHEKAAIVGTVRSGSINSLLSSLASMLVVNVSAFSACRRVTTGTKTISTTAHTVPMTINGVRLPHFLTSLPFALSLSLPKSGNINNESKLSSPIIIPRAQLGSPYACSSKRGTTKSYAVQKSIMIANAKPTLNVCG